jgi:hypothetical protein
MKYLGALLLVGSMLAAFGCSGGEDAPTDVTTIQGEAKSQVPEGLGTVPKEQAQEGLNMMGGGMKGGGGK